MKKILLVAAVAGLAMVSCKKEYTCECVLTTDVMGTTSTQTNSYTSGKMKKQEATDWCEAMNANNIVAGIGGAKNECEIK